MEEIVGSAGQIGELVIVLAYQVARVLLANHIEAYNEIGLGGAVERERELG